VRHAFSYPILMGIIFGLGFTPMIHAATTNYYPFKRHFRAVSIETPLPLSACEIRGDTRELTGIVGPLPVLTNSAECVLQTGLAWMQSDPLAAWIAATGAPSYEVISTNQILDGVGWLSGIRTNENQWGAFHWFLQNRIVFQTPTQTVWYSAQGVSNDVVRVLVGSLGDFEPGEICENLSPAPPSLSPHSCLTTQTFWRADLNAYLRLVETRWVPPHTQDADHDGIPDFADGYNADGIAGNSDDQVPGDFLPAWQILLPPIEDPATFLIRIVYSASDPLGVILTESGNDFQPSPGALRLWLQRAQALRNGLSFTLGGDYLPPGTYTAEELGLTPDSWEWILYLEMIQSNDDDYIHIDWSTDGGTRWRAMERLDLCAINVNLVPDWNHDRMINDSDKDQATTNNPFHFWINDDNDVGDIAEDDSDLPGHLSWGTSPADYSNGQIDGRCDLLDFSPIWLDLNQALTLLPPSGAVQYKLKQGNNAVRAVYTDLTKEQAGNFLTTEGNTFGPAFNQNSFEAETFEVTASGVTLSAEFLNKIKTDKTKGILLIEGAGSTTSPLVLEIWKDGAKIYEKKMPLSLDGVEKMYRWINLRHVAGGIETRATDLSEPTNNPDILSNGKNFVFVHGYSVDEQAARSWNAETFKRLYWSGSLPKFYAVTWFGNDSQKSWLGGNTPDYHVNAVHALDTAGTLATTLNNQIGGNITVAAHSLGNMVVSAAIAKHGANVTNYFMVDGAIAIEAFDGSPSLQNNNMWNTDWPTYAEWLWCSEWHTNFPSGDGRRGLTWRDTFSSVANVACNFYSSGEEVLKTHPQGTYPGLWCYFGGEYGWALQEKRKGLNWIPSIGGSTYGGWGVNDYYWNEDLQTYIAPTDQKAILSRPFFRPGGSELADLYVPTETNQTDVGSQYATNHLNFLLAGFIPSRTLPIGANRLITWPSTRNFNMQYTAGDDGFQNDWPSSRSTVDWHHSDLREVAYLYNYKLFDKFRNLGGLDQP
jgi:hypothetical protein